MAAKVKRRSWEHALECIAALLLVGVFATLAALVVMSYQPDAPTSWRRPPASGWHHGHGHGLPACRCGR